MEIGSTASENHDHHENTISLRALPSPNTFRDEIKNFDHLRENITEKLKLENWIVVTSFQNLYIFNLNKKLNGNLSIRNTISIGTDLIVKVFDGVKDDTIFDLRLYRWPQLQTLIEQLTNVKREDDLDFECVMETQLNSGPYYGFRDDYESGTRTGAAAFEFCGMEAETDILHTYDVYEPATEPLATTTVHEESDSFLRVKSEFTNFVESPSVFIPDSPYICSDCGKEFDENAKLVLHMKVHQSKFCPICNETFTGRRDRHIKRHFKKKSYQCHICGAEYKNKFPFEKHMQLKHFADDEFYCDICKDGKNFGTKILIEFHMQSKHNNETKKVENFQIEWVQAAEERMRKQYGIPADSENQSFNSENTGNHSDASQTLYKCVACVKEFSTERQLSNHMKRHDPSQGKHCGICNKTYYSSLSRHINHTHNKVKNHVCDSCGAAFTLLASLKEHISIKHTTHEGFSCDICENGKVYRSRAYLKKHLKAHARAILKESSSFVETCQENKVHECNLCNETFSSRYTLKRHAAIQHNNGNYKCQHCNEIFPSRYTLKSHTTLKHNDGSDNAPQYKCKVCDKKFGMRSTLSVHEKLHTGNIHICHECGQSFKHPHYLRKHLNRHKGVKKKECKTCGKQYANNVDLRLHMKKVHGVIVKTTRPTTVEKIVQ